MVFMCFSSKDRHQLVESLLFHITNYSIPVWYDRHQMLLGDNRNYKNFTEGIGKSDYALIVLSPNSMIESCCAREEIEWIQEKHELGCMTVFPIFFNIKAADIPSAFNWMKKLVYKELDVSIDSRGVCNHIISKYLLDELNRYKIKTIERWALYTDDSLPLYLLKIIETYLNISKSNANARISLIYAGCLYIEKQFGFQQYPEYYYKGIDRLFCETKLHLPIDLREILIIERLFLLLLNASVFGYIPKNSDY